MKQDKKKKQNIEIEKISSSPRHKGTFERLLYIRPLTLLVLVVLLLLWGEHTPLVKNLWHEKTETCEIIFENLTLQSVSGIEDIDTGLLSGGSVYRKDLLFANGRIEQFRIHELPDLILGRQYRYEVCKYAGGFMGLNSGTKRDLSLIEEVGNEIF